MGGAGRRENSTLYCLVPVFGSYVPVVEYTYFNNQIGCKVRTRAASRRPVLRLGRNPDRNDPRKPIDGLVGHNCDSRKRIVERKPRRPRISPVWGLNLQGSGQKTALLPNGTPDVLAETP